jgi:hypothetical protein
VKENIKEKHISIACERVGLVMRGFKPYACTNLCRVMKVEIILYILNTIQRTRGKPNFKIL